MPKERERAVSYWQREDEGGLKADKTLCEGTGRLEWVLNMRGIGLEKGKRKDVWMLCGNVSVDYFFIYIMRFQILFIILSLTKNLFFQVNPKS